MEMSTVPISPQEQADLEGELHGKDWTDYQLRNDIQTVNNGGDNRFFVSVVQRIIQPLALCVYPEEWEGGVEGVIRKSSRNLSGPSSRNNTPASGLSHLWQEMQGFLQSQTI